MQKVLIGLALFAAMVTGLCQAALESSGGMGNSGGVGDVASLRGLVNIEDLAPTESMK